MHDRGDSFQLSLTWESFSTTVWVVQSVSFLLHEKAKAERGGATHRSQTPAANVLPKGPVSVSIQPGRQKPL